MPGSIPFPRRDPSASLLADYSFEITGKDARGVAEAARSAPAGTRVNVTFLGSESHSHRLAAVDAVRAAGLRPVPHIAARRLGSEDELAHLLERLRELDAHSRLFLVGGDPSRAAGPYPHAAALIDSGMLERFGVREAGIAGYPEGHTDIPEEALWEQLERNVAALEERGIRPHITTQFGFDSDRVVHWIVRARERAILAEVRVGVAGPVTVSRLLAYARRFGVGANALIVKKYGLSLTNLLDTAGPDRFVDQLAAGLAAEGVAEGVALHLYAFGGVGATVDWAEGRRRKDL